METTPTIIVLTLFSSIFILFTTPSHSTTTNSCKPEFCDPNTLGPLIRFPFRIQTRHPARCGYPGFDLYCNAQNQTILNLPLSGEFVVDYIDYARQALYINDPGFCLPNRILNFSMSGTPYRGDNMRDYTFMNCSSDWMSYYTTSSRYMPLLCLSGNNYTVVAVNSRSPGLEIPAGCRRIADVAVPMQWAVTSMFYWSAMDMREDLELVWREPDCLECENQGGICGFRNAGSGLDVGCSRPARTGLPRSAKYGITIGIGIPGILCMIGLVSYGFGMLKAYTLQRRLNSILPTTTTTQRLAIRSAHGLDGPTIESYPMTVLGESRRLPKPGDATCPICLSDYEAKETIKSIPECNHYFHVDCINEWLKLNGSCPLCRNSPESSSATACSSVSTTTSDDR